jgi:hypothetical protein
MRPRAPLFLALTLLCAVLCAVLCPAQSHAQSIVTSGDVQASSVTIYRNPERGAGGEIDLGNLQGLALITETRTVTLPAGESIIRFEGVAGGIIPVSAIVTGLPGGVVQKNRDAHLLSPAALVDGSLGKNVHLKRTNRSTGKVIEEDAEIVAGPGGGVILKTRGGVEALGCSGLPESLVYQGMPPGLTARPTLSVTTRSQAETTATVQLSYLATGFDWGASYTARVAENAKSLDLFAWVTLANSNGESFKDANTQAIAGTINRDADAPTGNPGEANPVLSLSCWPLDITSTHPAWSLTTPGPPPPTVAFEGAGFNDIVVTAQKRMESLQSAPMSVSAMSATQEELGDLKLYRIPEPVTVSANGQKQVAFLQKKRVAYDQVYGARVYPGNIDDAPQTMAITLRFKNEDKKGLGVPLPSGAVTVFDAQSGLLVGSGVMRDVAKGEEFDLPVAQSTQVHLIQTENEDGSLNVEITNANPFAVTTEVLIYTDDGEELKKPSAKLTKKYGKPLWLSKVRANGSAKLTYRRAEDEGVVPIN